MHFQNLKKRKNGILVLKYKRGLIAKYIFNRLSVSGAVLQTPSGYEFIHSFINQLSRSSFVEISSRYPQSQTVRARDLTFLENVDLWPHVSCQHVMCHVSRVICHMSFVTCHVSHVMCHMSCVTCHASHVMCHMSSVTCHV